MRIVVAILLAIIGGFSGAIAGWFLGALAAGLLSLSGFRATILGSLEFGMVAGFIAGAIGLPLFVDAINSRSRRR